MPLVMVCDVTASPALVSSAASMADSAPAMAASTRRSVLAPSSSTRAALAGSRETLPSTTHPPSPTRTMTRSP